MPDQNRAKLDGWKAIADYLGKDVSTVSRWARSRKMPVHRLPGGKGATVYAYQNELDAWVQGIASDELQLEETAPVRERAVLPRRLILITGLALLVACIGLLVFTSRTPTRANQVSFSANKLVALDKKGQVVWEHQFAQRLIDSPSGPSQPIRFADLEGSGKQEFLVVASFADEGAREVARQQLYCFSPSGEVLWSYEPQLSLRFSGRAYEGPWRITDWMVQPAAGAKTIWVAVAHRTWWPSFLVKLDPKGKPTVQFVNSGGIYTLSYIQTETGAYVLASGVNNEYSAGMLAVLDENQPPSASVQSADSLYRCDTCPEGQPYRYFLFPRSELNRLQGDPYNPVRLIQAYNTYIELWTSEVLPNAHLLMTLSKSLDIEAVSMSDGYVELHQRLEREGKVNHPVQECPAFAQPYRVGMWDPQNGWAEVKVPWVLRK